jgi:hypothetical protein
MNERREYFDEDLDLKVSPELSKDLNTLFRPKLSVPPEVDRVIMDKAHQHFGQKHWRHRVFRHIRLWKVAAAAAVIILAFSLNLTQKSGPTTSSLELVKARAVDIDENGQVDILDAFKLARYVESAGGADKKWDINGDGLVNSEDVDLVAKAAVRLDKGVL